MATRVPGPWHTQQEMLQISSAVSFTRNKSPVAILNVWESKNILCVRVHVCACVRAHTRGWREICKTKTRQTKEISLFLQINMHMSNITIYFCSKFKQSSPPPTDTELKTTKACSIGKRRTKMRWEMAFENQLTKNPAETNKQTKILTNSRLKAQKRFFFFTAHVISYLNILSIRPRDNVNKRFTMRLLGETGDNTLG